MLAPDQKEESLVDFSEALKLLKEGRKLQRSGWNGKGLYVQLQTAIPLQLGTRSKAGDPIVTKQGTLAEFFIIVNDDKINTWVPSVSDILAKDWIVVN